MAHAVTLVDPQKHLDQDTLQDFIDLFFDACDSAFVIEVVPTYGKTPNPSIRGLCAANGKGGFKITLYAANIEEQMGRNVSMGGNVTKARDLKHGLYLVLTHELRHAHQSIYFGQNTTLHKGQYKGRAGEVDARRHVDENYENVSAFLGIEVEPVSPDPGGNEVDILIDYLAEATETDVIHEDEVWDQVMTCSGDPEAVFRRVQSGLLARGLRLG